MANSYTTVPAIIPGNLTVSGNLMVKGGQFAMGRYPRMYRIQELGNGVFVETVNLDKFTVQQDDPTVQSQVRSMGPMGSPFQVAIQSPGVPATDDWLIILSSSALQVLVPQLRVGAAAPYARLFNTGLAVYLTENLQGDFLTRDSTAYAGYALGVDAQHQATIYQIVNAAGVAYSAAPPLCVWSDYSVHASTGVTGTATLATHTLRSNAMGPNSALMVTISGKVAIAAGGGINFFLGVGSIGILFYSFPASTSGPFRATAIIANQNNPAIQNVSAALTYNQVVNNNPISPGSQDTTQDCTLAVYGSVTLAADSITVSSIEAHLLNTWGPI